jgi:hypothetical protein
LSTENYRLRSNVARTMRERDQLELNASIGLFRPVSSTTTEVYGLGVVYRRQLRTDLLVAPFTRYDAESADGRSLSSPRVGLSATWNPRVTFLDTILTARASYGAFELSNSIESREESQGAFALYGTLGHGRDAALRQELEFEYSRNELRLTRDPVPGVPDQDLAAEGLGTEDFRRTRVTLAHRWNSRSISGWGQWTERRSSGSLVLRDIDAETLMTALQYGAEDLDFSTNAGRTRVNPTSEDAQELSFLGAQAIWRPVRKLQVRAAYREDFRRLELAPDVDRTWLQLALVYQVGLLDVEGTVNDTINALSGGTTTKIRTFTWTVRRRFAGWLPVVTGTQRRGVIR